MDKLKERSEQLLQAYSQLEHIVAVYQRLLSQEKNDLLHCLTVSAHLSNEEAHIICRDSVIKRFEFCFDITWKFLKLLLKNNFDVDVASPRFAFQESLQNRIISTKESKILETMLNARNYTSHIYDEEIADSVAKDVIKYFPELFTMIQRLVKSR